MTAMVGRGSPKLSMIPKGSPKFGRMLSAASTRMKTVSPQSILAKKTASSPKGMVFIVCSWFLNTQHNVHLLCL